MELQNKNQMADSMKCKMVLINILGLIISLSLQAQLNIESVKIKPLRLGIIGLVHDHVHGVFQNRSNPDIEIVGIAEPDTALVTRYVKLYHLDRSIIYSSTEELIATAKPEAVSAFTSISDHIKVVRICAPYKISVMVEKPLSINYQQAVEMNDLAKCYKRCLY